PIPPPVVPPPLPSWRRVRNALKALGAGLPKPPARTLAVVAAVLVALAGLTAVGLVLFRESSCKPPLELRLLTDPDIEPTVRKAAEDYLTSDANTTDDGCRRSGITVYSAGAADVVAAFRDQSDPWQRPTSDDINPQRDIGPQPDIWIPASSANVARARATTDQRRWAELVADPAAFAYSPIVLAVPQALATEGSGRTSGLGELMAGLKGKAEVRRTDPEYTDAGLLATVGLYGAHGTGNAGAEKAGAAGAAAAERSVAQLGPPSPTGADLLCVLPDDDAVDDRTAALVPEFLMKTGVSCDRTTRARRMAEYPDDVPGLDPTFVRVRWDDADRDTSARSAEVERFHDWLTGAGAGGKDGADAAQGGLAEFGKDGFRSASGDHPPLGSGFAFSDFGALSAPGRLTDSVHQDAMSATLTDYRDAHGPGRVLFLLDSSGSMGDLWEGPGGAPGIVKQSLGGLGTQDEYGVWAVASEAGAKRPYSELLAFGQYGRGVAERAIDRTARVRNAEADPYGALIAALNTMAQRGVDDDRPQLIVYLTDDEDNNRLTEGGRLDNLLRSAQSRMVPVVMASLDSGGCDEGKADAAISEASGGRCLDTRTDLVAALRDEVARTGTGEE
ncbi:vWA domain-containing protein, partial [Streptomyces lunaelactis]|uniref:vWA domain-containing protein n=1 Tax=Streptomyces lunaelactis TaxID=1535768 RepID=UPI001C2FBA72